MKYWASRRERRRLFREIRPRMYSLKDQAFETFEEGTRIESEVWGLIGEAERFNDRRDRRVPQIQVVGLSRLCAQYSDDMEYAAFHGGLKHKEPESSNPKGISEVQTV